MATVSHSASENDSNSATSNVTSTEAIPTTGDPEPTTTDPEPTTGSDTGAICGTRIPACGEVVYPVPGAPFAVGEPEVRMRAAADICNGIKPEIEVLEMQVFRPDPLPLVPLPFVVMTNGEGQDAFKYEHVLRPLAEMGFVAVSVKSIGKPVTRGNAMACAMRWLRTEWSINNCVVPNCDVVLMGHSRGGEAAWYLGNTLKLLPWNDINTAGVDVNLKALIGLAPVFETASSYGPDVAVPYLGILGSTDEDVPGHGIIAYDSMISEVKRTSSDPAKLFLWPYDVPHNAFGGGVLLEEVEKEEDKYPVLDPLTREQYSAKGIAIASTFVPAFIDLFVLGNEARYATFTGDDVPDELTPEMDTSWWSYLEPAFTELGGKPVIRRDFVLDQRDNEAIRSVIDDFEEMDMGAFFSTLAADQVELGSQLELAKLTSVPGRHTGTVMRVRWGPDSDGSITWDLDGDLGGDPEDFSFLSLRIGQELILDNLAACSLLMTDPHRDALELIVQLEDELTGTADAVLGPIVQQDSRRVPWPGGGKCAPSQFMSTIRIPMSAFCATPGFDITKVVKVRITFPDVAHSVGVYLDTLEFTRHPLDDASRCD